MRHGSNDDVKPAVSISETTWRELFLVVFMMALLSALMQVAVILWWKLGPGYMTRLGPRIVWMTPLAVVLVYAIPAVVLLLISRFWRRALSLPVVVGVFSLLATIDLALMERRLALWAIGLLGLGIGVQVGRIAERHRDAVMRFARTALAALIALLLAGTTAVELGILWQERRSESALPAAQAGVPNVLFIILDTVRALNLSLYGYERETTPVLDSLASVATVYDRAIVTGTWSVPSHASMFTGHWPHALESWWERPRRAPVPTLAETFAQRGYRTGAVVANWWSLGHESGLAQGFVHYDDLGVSFAQIMRGSSLVRWLAGKRAVRRALGFYDTLGRRNASDISRNFLVWLGEDAGRPWFTFLNYLDAHSPYLPPAPFDRQFGHDVSEREPIVMEELNRLDDPGPEAAAIETAAYDGSIAYLDSEIGNLLRRLEERGSLANTIVVITSDHGEELGEHGAWGHGRSLHAESVHVPLLLFGPGIPAGVRVEEPTSIRHIAATVAELSGGDASVLGGRSLSPTWPATISPPASADAGPGAEATFATDPVDTVLTEMGTRRAIYLGSYHYIEPGMRDGAHLFDATKDPTERNDLIGRPVADSILPPMRQILALFTGRAGGGAERATGR